MCTVNLNDLVFCNHFIHFQEKIAANAAIFLYTSYCILYTILTVYKTERVQR